MKIWLFLFAALACAQAPANLIARWRSLETSKGGIGAMYEFHNDGTLSFSPGAVVETKYRVEGNELIFPPGTTNGPEQRQTMSWLDADHLALTVQGQSMTLSRQGTAPDPNNLLLGDWTTPREMSGAKMTARYLFQAGGKSLFLLPFTTQKGHYSATAATIRIDLPGRAAAEGPFHIDGDVLTIPGPRGAGQSKFERY